MGELTINQALQQAVAAHKAGQLQEADRLYTAILKAQPKHPDANHNMGILAVGVGKIEQALPFFKTALEANSNTAQFWLSYIDALIKLEQLADAKSLLDQARSKGANGDGFDKLERRLRHANNEFVPDTYSAQTLQLEQISVLTAANQFKENGEFHQAIDLLKKGLRQSPENVDILALLSHCYILSEQPEEAKVYLSKAKAITLENASVGWNTARLLLLKQRAFEALNVARQTTHMFPNDVEGMGVLGACLRANNRITESMEVLNKAIELKPNYAEALINRGLIRLSQKNKTEALSDLELAHRLKPHIRQIWDLVISLKIEAQQFSGAISFLEEMVEADPKNESLWGALARCYYAINNFHSALEACEKALMINPNNEKLRAYKLFQQANICDWDSTSSDFKIIPKLGTENEYVPPFSLLTFEDAPERHRKRSEIYAKYKYLPKASPQEIRPNRRSERIKLGYFGADFHNHPTMHLMAQVFALHNKAEFEIFVYSYGPNKRDNARKKLVNSVEHFFDVRGMTDADIVSHARANKLDLAIDLKGYTKDQRLGIFSHKVAPVQISYLGYPGTLGTDFIDYIVADPIIIPENMRRNFTEQIIYLPNTYQPTDNTRLISNKVFTRQNAGLPDHAFVLCCFNRNYKISIREFDVWMRILGKVPDSVLWLIASNKVSKQNLIKETQIRGIDPDRLVFADKLPQAEHLARQKLADLFIDTFNINAHTTASDALWVGLPLVTKLGKGFASRVAASLLNAVGLPELIAETEQEYESLILELSTNPGKLAKLKDKLEHALLTQPLFNTELYTKHLESGYQKAYQNYLDGNTPRTFSVER